MAKHHFTILLSHIMLMATASFSFAQPQIPTHAQTSESFTINTPQSLRMAIDDLQATYGSQYPKAKEYLERLDSIELDKDANRQKQKLHALATVALLDNPLLDFDCLILLKRKQGQHALPVNHKCNAGIPQKGYDNEIAILRSFGSDAKLQTLFKPAQNLYVGEIDLHFNADRLLFTMPNGRTWQIHEIKTDGTELRQISQEQYDVDNFDACYLPDGRIVFASTASYHAVPCWHGKERACAICLMNSDGTNVRQLCFDQDLDLHPSVLPSGQIIFSRWDYSGPMHIYLRPLMVMNPDGTGQRSVYGSNSYWPNALYYPRGIPGAPTKIIAVIAGYHGVPRMGELGLFDLAIGSYEADGILQRIPGRGRIVKPVIKDNLVDNSWPKFLHPYPLSEKYFLTAAQPDNKSPWGIYLVDVFDNMIPVCTDRRFDFFEPIPFKKTPTPETIPDKVDLTRKDAIVYLHDIYAGPGLADVPEGTIKNLRIIAYNFGYPGLAGPDKIGSGGPWEEMRILGTVPVNQDGSAIFRVPANTSLSVQALDADGSALQLMRSWFTAMPGEIVSCVGCHEKPNQIPVTYRRVAATAQPVDITPWRGPARGFDFQVEVQPVLDKYCTKCHDGTNQKNPDLRPMHLVTNYKGRELSELGRQRLHPDVIKALGGTRVKYTPAYEALIPFIRRPGIEDDVHLLPPGEYHTDTSQLVRMLEKGHHNIRLDFESWDRLKTWIDMNAPCHGSWTKISPVPENADKKRHIIAGLYGSIDNIPQVIPAVTLPNTESPTPKPKIKSKPIQVSDWPFDANHARQKQTAQGEYQKTIDLAEEITMNLVRIPKGRFIIGDENGLADEYPASPVDITESFWIQTTEVTNAQYRLFDPTHDSGYFAKRYQGKDGPGLSLNNPDQPVLRVSWHKAMAFCKWLSKKTGTHFTLPTEAQWEYACRAGTSTPLNFGTITADFSCHANLADKSLSLPPGPTGGLASNITAYRQNGIFFSALHGGNIPCDIRFDDHAIATANIAAYKPNPWGLYDMHGNAAEWTSTDYKPYPYNEDNATPPNNRKVVRGGSYQDRPKHANSSFRQNYLPWRRPFNTGFRVAAMQITSTK